MDNVAKSWFMFNDTIFFTFNNMFKVIHFLQLTNMIWLWLGKDHGYGCKFDVNLSSSIWYVMCIEVEDFVW